MKDAEEIAKEPVTNIDFIIWITESNEDMELNEEQEQVMDYLQDVLKHTLEFVS